MKGNREGPKTTSDVLDVIPDFFLEYLSEKDLSDIFPT